MTGRVDFTVRSPALPHVRPMLAVALAQPPLLFLSPALRVTSTAMFLLHMTQDISGAV